ncbi:MAG: DegT/DnrJ/EryC1/StrS family aminotransferase [Planctomycetota bacterium]
MSTEPGKALDLVVGGVRRSAASAESACRVPSTIRMDVVRAEVVKLDSAKPESARPESVKTESAKVAAPRTSVPLLDVGRGNRPLRDEFLSAIGQVIDSGRFLHGPDVKQLEDSVAQLSGTRHAVSCASGSDALLLALMALDIGPGDEVIVPSFTFFATASAAWRLGARPVFVDIEAETMNLDPLRLQRAITPATKAIIPVHLFGQCADMAPILQIAADHKITVIEDVAQAIGAKYGDCPAGSMGQIGCFSFYPTKNLGGFGDGGMLTTNDDALAERLRLLAAHGMSPRYYHREVGINSRLDTIQAAVLNVKFKHLAEWTRSRQENARRYHQLFTAEGLHRTIDLPESLPDREHVWNQYTIRVADGKRDQLRAQLGEMGIGSEVYYPVPLHQQQCFAALGYGPGSLPVTERMAAEVLSLPIYPEVTVAEQQLVVRAVSDLLVTRLRRAG